MHGAHARPRLRHVVRAMRDRDAGVAAEAVVALGMIGLPPANQLRTRAQWRRLLGDQDPAVRRRAVEALNFVGPTEVDALDVLRELTAHPDAQLAKRAQVVLAQLTR